MLERREIHRDHLPALFALKVRPDQTDLVAPNTITLAQAPYETGAQVWGLWDEDSPVGLMAMVHPDLYPWHEPDDDRQAAYLWRLMIGAEFQGKGYGRSAISLAREVAQEWTLPRIAAGVVNAPHSNLMFYERLGFRKTGRIVEGEIVITLTV